MEWVFFAGVLAFSYMVDYWIIYLMKEKGVKVVSWILLVESLFICTFVLVHGGVDGFSNLWILIAPSVCFLLLGRKMGLAASVLIFLEMIFVFWTPWGHALMRYPYEPFVAGRLPLIYLVLFVVTFFSETLRIITVEQLKESKDKMEAIYQNQYTTITERIREAKKVRHDIRHHFVAIGALLNDGDLEGAKKYIDQYYKSLPFEESLTYCDHYATNALLTYYLQRAKHDHIRCVTKVNLPEELPWRTDELTIAFGNLLENAVDASLEGIRESDTFEPYIEIKGDFDGHVLIVSIMNHTYRQAKMDENQRYISSKHEGNGIGIASVREMVEKNGGMFKIEQKNGEFIASIMLMK